ncbi:MAG TPA: DUF1080 domain-containing protein [Cyclobacteriaceae bacterium]
MKKLIGLAVVAVVLASCGTKKAETTADSTAVATPAATENTLTDAQKAEGWKSLFDGQTMNGWVTFKGKENNSWEVVDGTLHCKSPEDTTADKRADIRTTEEFENFEFTFDWKIAPKHNSGVMFRVTEEYEVPYGSGPEYQVIDDAGYPDALKPVQLSAANYDMHTADNKTMNPAGQWNTGKIVVNGNHAEHWLNGSKVLEYEFESEAWKKTVAGSKWKEFPGYGKAKKGYLDLQDHGGEVWFKNLFVKAL